MNPTLRIVDSGLRAARENLSITEALCIGRSAGTTPDTLRFQHFPRSAIVGRHQRIEREVNLDWVRANGVETARRMTGGGAIVMGPGILGWELIVSRARTPATLADIARVICTGVANGLNRLGVSAAFRPRNDIEIDGRKVSGTGGYFDDSVLVYQGTVLVELDREFLTQALAVPAHKLGKRGLATLNDRIGDLKDCLGAAPSMRDVQTCVADAIADALGMAPDAGGLTDEECRTMRIVHDRDIGTDAFVLGLGDVIASRGRTLAITRDTQGGSIEVALHMRDGGEDIVDQVLISGDYFVTPPRVIADLEAHLRLRRADALEAIAENFLTAQAAQFLGIGVRDIVAAIAEAARALNDEAWHERSL